MKAEMDSILVRLSTEIGSSVSKLIVHLISLANLGSGIWIYSLLELFITLLIYGKFGNKMLDTRTPPTLFVRTD